MSRAAAWSAWAQAEPASCVPDVAQKTDFTCGPGLLAAALGCFGLNATEDELAELAGTDETGTSLEALATVARTLGASAQTMEGMSFEQLRGHLTEGHPVILGTEEPGEEGHYLLAVGVDDAGFTLEDPGGPGGRLQLREDELGPIWHLEGHTAPALVLGPPGSVLD